MILRTTALLFLVPFTAALAAQDQPAAQMPDPKTPQHERLAAFAGTWRTEAKMAAMPGVPGMEKPTELVGTEHAELICHGLWLKVTGEGVCGGQACSGMWLLGYDPFAKNYPCLAVTSTEETPCSVDGRYDEKTKVWHFHGDTPMGPFRSEFVFESKDRSVETCYSKGGDGKETEFMRTVRTRVQGGVDGDAAPAPAIAVGKDAPPVPAAMAALQEGFGTFDADFRMEMPGMPPMTSKCREVVGPACAGKWTWSTFSGEMMGAPFEGHALTGCTDKGAKVVSFWFDSMNGPWMRTDGAYDQKARAVAMRGTCYDQQGKLSPVASTLTITGKDTRQLRMLFGEGKDQHVMTVDYRRAGK